jgi:hypothetical protein
MKLHDEKKARRIQETRKHAQRTIEQRDTICSSNHNLIDVGASAAPCSLPDALANNCVHVWSQQLCPSRTSATLSSYTPAKKEPLLSAKVFRAATWLSCEGTAKRFAQISTSFNRLGSTSRLQGHGLLAPLFVGTSHDTLLLLVAVRPVGDHTVCCTWYRLGMTLNLRASAPPGSNPGLPRATSQLFT